MKPGTAKVGSCPVANLKYTTTHFEDSRTYTRSNPAVGEPARGRTLSARLPAWLHANAPTTTDVSGAYGKTNKAVEH